jgi:hypothetical protein
VVDTVASLTGLRVDSPGIAAATSGVTRSTTRLTMRATDARAPDAYTGIASRNDVRPKPGTAKGGHMEPRVMAHSQTHRLRERMGEAAIEHGQSARVDLPGIRVGSVPATWSGAANPGTGIVFFCTMGPIQVHQVLEAGDGGALPEQVVLEGLTVPEPGTYDILNALVHSNGDLRVRVDASTRVIQRVSEVESAWGSV